MTGTAAGLSILEMLVAASPKEVSWVVSVLQALVESAMRETGPTPSLAEVRFWPESRETSIQTPIGGGRKAVASLVQHIQGLMLGEPEPNVSRTVQTRLRLTCQAVLKALQQYVPAEEARNQDDEPARAARLRLMATGTKYTKRGSQTPSSKQTVSIIVPAAGRSSRFPNMKPKWMLTQPNGRLMVVDALSALDFTCVSAVYVGLLREHIDSFCGGDPEAVLTAFADGIPALQTVDVHLVIIPHKTSDQVETIEWILHSGRVSGAIFLKDCDNQFAATVEAVDGIAILEVTRDNEDVVYNIASKGFVAIDTSDNSLVVNVIEKKMISNQICIGAYAFSDANSVQKLVLTCRRVIDQAHSNVELAVSDLYWWMLLAKKPIKALVAGDYMDWGTLAAWQRYCSTFKTLFVDIDGTLVKNSGQYFSPRWGTTPPLAANVAYLQQMHDTGRIKIILTTSRTEEFREATLKQLEQVHCPYDQIIFGLQHAQRVVINDFAPTNPFPSALAVNLNRNDDNLRQLFPLH